MENQANHHSRPRIPGQNPRGQVVVEYILLLVVAVSIAVLITTTMVSRSPEEGETGFVIVKWQRILQAIAQDRADDVNP